jgi:hypothetical protein
LLVELYAIYKGLLLARDMSIDELVWYSDYLHSVNLIKCHQVTYHIFIFTLCWSKTSMIPNLYGNLLFWWRIYGLLVTRTNDNISRWSSLINMYCYVHKVWPKMSL